MQVYEAVKAYIDEHHMKQISVARAAGISNVTFNAILNGKRKMYAEDLRAICIALDVPADMFIERKSA